MTPYQEFVTAELFGVAHTAQTTKSAWNTALEKLRIEIRNEIDDEYIHEDELNRIIDEMKEK